MTRALGIRQYRACVRCRARKTRCDLQNVKDPGHPPCVKCLREGAECVLAGSRRGGNYSHLRRVRPGKRPESVSETVVGTVSGPASGSGSGSGPVSGSVSGLTSSFSGPASTASVTPLPPPGDPVHDSLQNPSDALLILAHATGLTDIRLPPASVSPDPPSSYHCHHQAGGETIQGEILTEPSPRGDSQEAPETAQGHHHHHHHHAHEGIPGSLSDGAGGDGSDISYPLLADGTMDLATMKQLVLDYSNKYHAFFPIVPAECLQPARIVHTIRHEPFLLTAMLVVASKDRPEPELAALNRRVWAHMRLRILDVVLGVASVRRVGCVEGLLLLGEWTLLDQPGQRDDGGEGAAWSIVGLAVRLAYLLRLEDISFKGGVEREDAKAARERLAWTFTYISDRQISIRMGQAFWCRGPSLSARFKAQDFPALQPRQFREASRSSADPSPHDNEDFASLLQAQVELTTLFGNVHDILFASRSRTAELMVRGDYVKYIDDTSKAMAAWQRAWRAIDVSPYLRSTLTLMQEYLRLYVNAFAFQAVLYRTQLKIQGGVGGSGMAAPGAWPGPNPGLGPWSATAGTAGTTTTPATATAAATRASPVPGTSGAGPPAISAYFPDSTMATGDARHIYAAVDAAERLLTIVSDDIPARHLRHMPARYYLYEIHSSVFLYKAFAAGAVRAEDFARMTALMQRFIAALRAAAAPDAYGGHIAARYAQLLSRLWSTHIPVDYGDPPPGPESALGPEPRLGPGFSAGSGSAPGPVPGLAAAEMPVPASSASPRPFNNNMAMPAVAEPMVSPDMLRDTGLRDPREPFRMDCSTQLLEDFGLPSFDCTDTMDTLFALPPVMFSWDGYPV